MRCEPFETFVKELLRNADRDQIKAVRTFHEDGFPKPCGLVVTDSADYSTYIQFVRTSPPPGDTDNWPQRPEYQARLEERRTMAEARTPKPGALKPALRVRDAETLLRKLLDDSGHPEVLKVQTYAESVTTTKPAGLRVTFTNQSEIFASFLGVAPPGYNRFNHPDYQPPKEIL